MNTYKPIDPDNCPPDGWYWFADCREGYIAEQCVLEVSYGGVRGIYGKIEWDRFFGEYTHYCPAIPPEFKDSES